MSQGKPVRTPIKLEWMTEKGRGKGGRRGKRREEAHLHKLKTITNLIEAKGIDMAEMGIDMIGGDNEFNFPHSGIDSTRGKILTITSLPATSISRS
jgi:hypothetical protein